MSFREKRRDVTDRSGASDPVCQDSRPAGTGRQLHVIDADGCTVRLAWRCRENEGGPALHLRRLAIEALFLMSLSEEWRRRAAPQERAGVQRRHRRGHPHDGHRERSRPGLRVATSRQPSPDEPAGK